MSKEKELKQYATSHYAYYPNEDVPAYLAYGFRPMFLLLAPYIVISIILWGLVWGGVLNLSFTNDILTWHMYEMLFGIGTAGIVAFFLTGAPEMFPGVIPTIGKKLIFIVGLWLLGRISFWLIDYVGVYFVALTNLPLLFYITSVMFKPVLFDPNKKHYSFVYMLVILITIQSWFFLSMANHVSTNPTDILKVALGAFIVLILVALRRINMEAVNELLEDLKIDETFLSKPFRYNLAIFTITIYTIVEFLFPTNSTLGWIALSCSAATLGILNDFILKDNNILFKPFIMYMMSILLFLSIGYFFIGFAYLNNDLTLLTHFRHFLTTGVYGLVFYMVLVIVSTIHTGRHIFTNFWTHLGVLLIICSTFIRAFIPFYEQYTTQAYLLSSILWAIPFIIYMKIYFPFLLKKRDDGLPG